MANKIAIPKLGSQITPLRVVEIDIDANPYRSIVGATAELKSVLEQREALDRQIAEQNRLAQQQREADEQRAAQEADPPGEPGFSSESDRAPPAEWPPGRVYPYTPDGDFLRDLARENERRRRSRVDETFEDLADIVYWEPSRIGEIRDEAEAVAGILPEDERERTAEARRRINEQYLRGLMRENPKAALEMLRSRAGAAESDLGISEEMREELEAEAERAVLAEQIALAAGTHVKALVTTIEARRRRIAVAHEGAHAGARAGLGDYGFAIDAFDWDAKSAERAESETDKTVRQIQAFAKEAAKAGMKLLTGDPGSWEKEERVKALDRFVKRVVGEDWWSAAAGYRMVGVSRLAKRTPDAVREHVRTGARSRDPAKRAFAGRVLKALEHVDAALNEWAEPDIRAFGHDFSALTQAGFSESGAVARIEAGSAPTPQQREARAHAFGRRVDAESIAGALNEALAPGARDLLYRPERDKIIEERGPYRPDGRARAVELDYGSPYGGTIPGGTVPGPSNKRDERLYDDGVLTKIKTYRKPILDIAQKLGVSETAIAGCIAEELDDARRRGWVEDIYGSFKSSILEGKTHDDYVEAYEDWERVLAENPEAGDPRTGWGVLVDTLVTGYTKFQYPATLDIGQGKIRLHTAIRMLREYNERYPDSDPLGIKKYNKRYDLLARDLAVAEASTTAVFVGLMVEEATRWFESKLPERWAAMSQEDRDALIVEYYNQGRERIRARYDEDMKRDGYYSPELGDSGKRHRVNAGFVRQQVHPL